MKKLTLIVLLISCMSYAQNKLTFSIGGDVRNCIVGSDPTNNEPKADLLFKLTIQNQSIMEFGLGAEVFPAIDYTKVFVSIGARLPILERLDIIASLEPSVIDRTGTWGGSTNGKDVYRSYVTGGGSLVLRYKPFNSIYFEAQTNITYREDLVARYGEKNPLKASNYLSIVFAL